MESKKINQLATELAPDLSDITIIGDPTTGISKKITLSQMASLFTGTVEEYANFAAFPLVGVADTIYIAKDTNVIYRWDSTAYVVLSPNIIASLVFNDANGFDGTIALVGSVATLTITTALTSGSVPFIGASGALTQDNANLFFDDTNNRLGIATASPTTPLDVFGSGIIGRLNATSTNNSYLGFASNGTNKWSAGNVQSDHRFRIFSEANSAELITILQTGEFGIGIANPLTKLHIDGGATALIANLDANVSVAKSLSFRSDNSNRINLEVSGTESGSNAGANLFIRAYSDAGALLNTPLSIIRSTGNVGIQSSNPDVALLVGGTSVLTALASPAQMSMDNSYLNSSTQTGDKLKFYILRGTNIGLGCGNIGDFNIWCDGLTRFYNGGSERARITQTGNFGLGATAPAESFFGINRIFEIGGSTVPGIVLRSTLKTGEHSMLTGGDGLIISSTGSANAASDNVIKFYTGATNSSFTATERMRITSNGNIGFGTNNPLREAVLYRASGEVHFKIANGTTGEGNTDGFDMAIDSSGGAYLINRENQPMYFLTNGTERARFLSGGQFCVATTTAVAPGGVTGVTNLINPNNNGIWALALQNNATSTSYGRGIGIRNLTDFNSADSEFIFCIGNATPRFVVNSNGGIANYTANNNPLSDIRIKKDIILLESVWSKVKAIEVVKYKFKDQTHDDFNMGVIAQQVQSIAPELVSDEGWGTFAEDGTAYKSIWENDMNYYTMKALQEAMAKIEALEEKVKQLQSK